MEEFLLRQNIDRYRRLLDTGMSQIETQTISSLLAEAETKLAQLTQARAKDPVGVSRKE
jgi:hypothetical protein